jgi:hypothetical protein
VAEVRAAARPCITGEAEHTEVTLDAVNRRGRKAAAAFRARRSSALTARVPASSS